jgi:hypothetical protein
MVDFLEDLRREVEDLIAAETTPRAPDWKKTEIGKWRGGVVEELLRTHEPEWWRRDARGSSDLAAVNELLERVGMSKLKTRDDAEEENHYGASRGSVTAKEVNEAQREGEKTGARDSRKFESYLPKGDENAMAWANDLPKRVDTNTEEARPWFTALLSYVTKFPPDAKMRDLDQGAITTILKQICGGKDE